MTNVSHLIWSSKHCLFFFSFENLHHDYCLFIVLYNSVFFFRCISESPLHSKVANRSIWISGKWNVINSSQSMHQWFVACRKLLAKIIDVYWAKTPTRFHNKMEFKCLPKSIVPRNFMTICVRTVSSALKWSAFWLIVNERLYAHWWYYRFSALFFLFRCIRAIHCKLDK